MEEVLDTYSFTAEKFLDDAGTVTLSLNEIDLIENTPTEAEAKKITCEIHYGVCRRVL